jgi:hypothetical protein
METRSNTVKVILYVGDHAADSWDVRLGWILTRIVQYISLTLRFKPTTYYRVTHTECILAENPDGTVTIASASIRDGFQVRKKENVVLTPGNWLIGDRPEWSVEEAINWFAVHDGEPYDWLGAGTCWLFIVLNLPNHWFCNGADGAAAGIKNPEKLMPCQFAEIVMA